MLIDHVQLNNANANQMAKIKEVQNSSDSRYFLNDSEEGDGTNTLQVVCQILSNAKYICLVFSLALNYY